MTENKIIHKEILEFPEDGGMIVELKLPVYAHILTAQVQNGKITLWYMWNLEVKDEEKETRKFSIIGTGWEIDKKLLVSTYINTVQLGPFVFHVFEVSDD